MKRLVRKAKYMESRSCSDRVGIFHTGDSMLWENITCGICEKDILNGVESIDRDKKQGYISDI